MSARPDPLVYHVAQGKEIQWMWADAKLLPGLGVLAKANPLRWSELLSWGETIDSLTTISDRRPVRLRILFPSAGSEGECLPEMKWTPQDYEFPTPLEAVGWMRACHQLHREIKLTSFVKAWKECQIFLSGDKFSRPVSMEQIKALAATRSFPIQLVFPGEWPDLLDSQQVALINSGFDFTVQVDWEQGFLFSLHFDQTEKLAAWLQECKDYTGPSSYPFYWTNSGDRQDTFKDTILMPPESLPIFQDLFDHTYAKASTRDRPCPRQPPCSQEGRPGGCPCSKYGGNPGLPVRYEVCQVLRLEDSECWRSYASHRCAIRQQRVTDKDSVWPCEPPDTSGIDSKWPHTFARLDLSSNEMYLLHGTNTRSALKIASEDVRLNLSRCGGGLGPGLYLSESATKSDEYASDTVSGGPHGEQDPYYKGIFAMLMMRVTMGKARWTEKFFSELEKKQNMYAIRHTQYDSVVGDRRRAIGTYREFCVFEKDQIYSEYVVFYRRIYHAEVALSVPRPMSADGRGYLRRGAFQFQVPSYWVNFHKNPDVDVFKEEHLVRPRGVILLQRALRLLSGYQNLHVRKAIRLENSNMLCEFVAQKVQLRTRGITRSGGSISAVFADSSQADEFAAAAARFAFSLENLDGDVNETFLWCGIQSHPNGEIPERVADCVREKRLLTVNPRDVLRQCKILCLCRAVCGEMAHTSQVFSDSALSAYDSIYQSDVGCKCFTFADNRQIYPEMIVWT